MGVTIHHPLSAECFTTTDQLLADMPGHSSLKLYKTLLTNRQVPLVQISPVSSSLLLVQASHVSSSLLLVQASRVSSSLLLVQTSHVSSSLLLFRCKQIGCQTPPLV